MRYKFDYSEEKDLILRETRNISFKDVIEAYKQGKRLANLKNKSKGRKNQRLLIVNIGGYAFATPYVIDKKRKVIFLKTVYPSRKLTKKYLEKLK